MLICALLFILQQNYKEVKIRLVKTHFRIAVRCTIVTIALYYSLLWGQLCERVTVTDVSRLYNFYEHVITQQLISD
jgi:hypothetical protein